MNNSIVSPLQHKSTNFYGAFFACMSALVLNAAAATITWDGGASGLGTAINTAGNWNPDQIPGSGDEALFLGVTPPAPVTIATNNRTVGDLIWNVTSGASGSIAISNTQTAPRLLILTGGGGSSAAIANGGATGDLLLLGSNITNGTFTVDGILSTSMTPSALGLQVNAAGNFNVVHSGATLAISAVITSSSTITKTGSGVLSISSNSSATLTGGLNVSAGTLLLAGGNVGSSAVTVGNNALLTGNGTVGSLVVQNGGILTPGNAGIGNLSASSVTLNSTSIANFQVNGAGGGQFDTLTASGAISLNGVLNLSFGSLLGDDAMIDLLLGTISGGTAFSSIVATGSYAGNFEPYAGSVVRLTAGEQYLFFDNESGILSVAAVPEPASAGMVAVAMLALCVILRRRNTKMAATAR